MTGLFALLTDPPESLSFRLHAGLLALVLALISYRLWSLHRA